ncbi:MAG: glycoside hydrolase family 20 zincin-like fold domain-containing protein, partial [Thermoanaerobaculia bacterium]
MSEPSLQDLLPLPQQASTGGKAWVIPSKPLIQVASSNPAYQPTVERLKAALTANGIRPERQLSYLSTAADEPVDVRLRIDPQSHTRPQAYRLRVGPRGAEIDGGDEAGLFHGVCTLVQWLRLNTATEDGKTRIRALPGLEVDDWPDIPARGVMLDVSRNKVPTMETLFGLVDLLAGWKINQLQLYTEHTFAYSGHERVWQGADPFTAQEIRELDRFCRERFIELVPNQNSLGHFHRWLVHDPYRELAECPQGVEHPFSDQREPFSLCAVDPKSLVLLEDLYDQLLPSFSSRLLNVGLDETFDLGLGRSAPACNEKGKGRVYLEYLQAIHRLLAARGTRMQFWGDIILEHPELIPELPRDAIPLLWGYEAGHPFAEQSRRFAASGLDYYVCPGTSSWNSLGGRAENALLNLGHAAVAGSQADAAGYLVTDWGDFGHLQPLPVSYLGFMAGAAFSWNAQTAQEPLTIDMAPLLDRHAFPGRPVGLGQIALELANVYRHTGSETKNGSPLFFLLLRAGETLEPPRYAGLDTEALTRSLAEIESAADRLARLRADDEQSVLVVRELRWVAATLALACRLGLARLEQGRDQS